MRAAVGDRLVVKGHRVGEHDMDAEILEVRGTDGGPPYFVRWGDDGREGLYFPGSDAVVVHPDPGPDPTVTDRLVRDLDGWKGQVDELRVRAALAEMELRERVEPLLQTMEEQLHGAVERAAGLRTATTESWDLLRSGVEEAVERVKKAAADAAAVLDKAA